MSAETTSNIASAICAAPGRSARVTHVVYTDTVSVRTPRNSAAPMSLRVSSSAKVTPTAKAGRPSGRFPTAMACPAAIA